MNELTKYESIQELKANTKPVTEASAQKAKQRHARFERFIDSLKDSPVKDGSPSEQKDSAYGL